MKASAAFSVVESSWNGATLPHCLLDSAYWQVRCVCVPGPPPPSDAVAVQVSPVLQVAFGPLPQQGSPAAPQAVQVAVPPLLLQV